MFYSLSGSFVMGYIKERCLHEIWDRTDFKRELRTADGRQIRVVHPGWYNTREGPDFKDSILKIDGQEIRGDVEIHIQPGDWKQHGHDRDNNYRRVVLHVVHHSSSGSNPVRTDAGIPDQIELAPSLFPDWDFMPEDIQPSQTRRLCGFFVMEPDWATERFLTRAGMARLEQHATRFSCEDDSQEQSIYTHLLRVMGYSANTEAMERLSRSLPWSEIVSRQPDAPGLAALLISRAALAERLPKNLSVPMGDRLREGTDNYIQSDGVKDPGWNFFRIRPANHPALRLLQLVPLLHRAIRHSLQQILLQAFSFPRIQVPAFRKHLRTMFRSSSDWLPDRLLPGAPRLDKLAVNLIIPLGLAYARNTHHTDLEKAAVSLYRSYPASGKNHLTGRMERYLRDPAKFRSREIYQQGLLYLYHQFCRYQNCDDCLRFKDQTRPWNRRRPAISPATEGPSSSSPGEPTRARSLPAVPAQNV